MTILDRILVDKINEVAIRKQQLSVNQLENKPLFNRSVVSMKQSLQESATGIISEFKRKSPSKGLIHGSADVAQVVSGYERAGASGISVLTDEPYFGGTPADFALARQSVSCPLLRKDFMIDEYQLFEAKAMGADVILLIAAALSVKQTRQLAARAKDLSLEVLLEIHNSDELGHINEFVDMVGVNNRDLKTFVTDVNVSLQLVEQIPDRFVKVSESGLSDVQTVRMLRQAGYKGFLMGENFMKENQPDEALRQFITELIR